MNFARLKHLQEFFRKLRKWWDFSHRERYQPGSMTDGAVLLTRHADWDGAVRWRLAGCQGWPTCQIVKKIKRVKLCLRQNSNQGSPDMNKGTNHLGC
jgi:hypothetical protein